MTPLATTPNLILGPFYPVNVPADASANLLSRFAPQSEVRKALVLSGHVYNCAGHPVVNALVEIWHADDHGHYPHPSAPQADLTDPRFTGYGVTRTNAEGRYRFETLEPAPYTEHGQQRAAHVHFQVTGQHDRLITQMFFPDDPLRETDHWYCTVRRPLQLVARHLPGDGESMPLNISLQWDIVLRKG